MCYAIETEHLGFRKARVEDAEAMYKNVWSDEELLKYTHWALSPSLESAKERILRNIEYQKKNPYIYFVINKENKEPIGFGGIMQFAEGVYSEAGLCIARKYQGRGYGKEMLKALLDLAFKKLNCKEFLYACFKDNDVSYNLCMHYPFVFKNTEKVFVERLNKEVEINVYSLTEYE